MHTLRTHPLHVLHNITWYYVHYIQLQYITCITGYHDYCHYIKLQAAEVPKESRGPQIRSCELWKLLHHIQFIPPCLTAMVHVIYTWFYGIYSDIYNPQCTYMVCLLPFPGGHPTQTRKFVFPTVSEDGRKFLCESSPGSPCLWRTAE